MAGLTVPAGYRSDLFIKANLEGPALLPLLRSLAKCWAGSETAIGKTLRVFTKSTWPGNLAAPQAWDAFYSSLKAGDLLAVPASWGDPPTSAACWTALGPTGIVVGNVVVSPDGKSYSFTPMFTQATKVRKLPDLPTTLALPSQASVTAYANALKDNAMLLIGVFFPDGLSADENARRIALYEAGSKCPADVDAARQAGTLDHIIAKSTPATFCADVEGRSGW